MIIYSFLKPSASQRPARLLLKWPSLHMHFCWNNSTVKVSFSIIVLTSGVRNSGVTAGPQGSQLREDPGRKGPERGPFSGRIARDGDWGPIF